MDRDLDPGSLTVPEISFMGCSTISGTVECFSVDIATEAEILRDLSGDAVTWPYGLRLSVVLKAEKPFQSETQPRLIEEEENRACRRDGERRGEGERRG